MAEDTRELSGDELDDIAGGVTRLTYLKDQVYRTIARGGTIDSVLAECERDQERAYVQRWWNDMWSPAPSMRYVKAHPKMWQV